MGTVQSPPEQRILLRNIRWETYERLLADHEGSSAPRFTYDRGRLEITSPLPKHERYAHVIELMVPVAAREVGKKAYGLGSTTFRREDLERGFEPDACFYFENRERVRGKDRLDLRVDPPPDLVVEIDITNPSLPKLPIYARLGVPEVWRYDGERLEILLLQTDGYSPSAESRFLPGIRAETLAALLEEIRDMDDVDLMDTVRERVRGWTRPRGAPPGEARGPGR